MEHWERRDDAVITVVQHQGGVVGHDVMGLYMEVTEGGIGFPTAKEPSFSKDMLQFRRAMAPVVRRDLAVMLEGISLDVLLLERTAIQSNFVS
jgi:hypothetical protein